MNCDIQTAFTLQCVGKLLEYCIKDPDPKAQEKYQEEFNCANCDNHPTCVAVLEAVKEVTVE